MKTRYDISLLVITRMLMLSATFLIAGCAGSGEENTPVATPTVDYVEGLDVYSAPHKDSFLNQLAMNYRSYAIYNARTSGYPDVGELFANKAISAFSGEVPFPETLDNWGIADAQVSYGMSNAYNEMIEQLQKDASQTHPEWAAEMQAKYDCWVSAVATGQNRTAQECKNRFEKALAALRDCKSGRVINKPAVPQATTEVSEIVDQDVKTITAVTTIEPATRTVDAYYPETAAMTAMRGVNRTRDGVVIVNNVNIPEHLIRPEPVQPMVFNQNIYGGDKTINDNSGSNSNNVSNSGNTSVASDCPCANREPEPSIQSATLNVPNLREPLMPEGDSMGDAVYEPHVVYDEPCECADEEVEEVTIIADDLVSRREFINMMMAMRAELAAINARLDGMRSNNNNDSVIVAGDDETTIIKVQQIPVEPKQHVMEEVFEIRFDFNKAVIKPEYEDIIRQLADVTQANKNVKVTVVGHTDTVGTSNYNYALGGRRADAVQKMLIKYGIPSSQIVAVSAGEEDLKVKTADGVPNAENRRVRVVKEVSYVEPSEQRMVPVANISVESVEEE